MMADIRMLQEQSQQLQNLLGTLERGAEGGQHAARRADRGQRARPSPIRSWSIDNARRICGVAAREGGRQQRPGRLAVAGSRRAAAVGRSRRSTASPRPVRRQRSDAPALARRRRRPPPPPARAARRRVAAEAAATGVWPTTTAGQYDLAIRGFEAYIKTFPQSPTGRRRAGPHRHARICSEARTTRRSRPTTR